MPERGVEGAWRALSLDPQRSAGAGLRWLSLGLFALIVANMGFRGSTWRRLLWTVMATGCVVWAIGLVQEASESKLFLGFYQAEIHIRTLSTFVSSNHAAVFFGLVSLAAFALAMQEYRQRVAQSIGASAVGIVALVLMATHQSDGTLLAYAIGLIVLAAGLSLRLGIAQKARRRLQELSGAQIAAIVSSLLGLVAIFVWMMGWPALVDIFEQSSIGRWLDDNGRARFFMAKAALVGAGDFWRFGSGAGSLEHVIAPYVDWSVLRDGTIPTIESEPIEWLMSMGVLPTLVAGGLLASGLWWSGKSLSANESRSRYIVAFGLGIYMLIVAMFHFPFFALGIALPFVVLVEFAIAPRARASSSSTGQGPGEGGRCHLRLSLAAGWAMWFASALAFALFVWLAFFVYDLDERDGPGERAATTAELATWLRLRPTDSQTFARLSIEARQGGELERAAALADRAFELRPTSRHMLFRARAHARQAEREQAVALYTTLFATPSFTDVRAGWIERFMIQDLHTASERADALSLAPREWWTHAAEKILAAEGLNAAVDFCLQLIERFPQEPAAHQAAIRVYQLSKQPALAELWARLLLTKNLDGGEGRAPPGYRELVSLLITQGNAEEAWQLLYGAAEGGVLDDTLAGDVLRIRPSLPTQASPEQVRLIEHARQTHCAPPINNSRLRNCWEIEAWLHELHARHEEARIVQRRIFVRWHDPRGLAALLARQRNCQQLAGLLRELSGEYTPARRHRPAVEKLSQQCSR